MGFTPLIFGEQLSEGHVVVPGQIHRHGGDVLLIGNSEFVAKVFEKMLILEVPMMIVVLETRHPMTVDAKAITAIT